MALDGRTTSPVITPPCCCQVRRGSQQVGKRREHHLPVVVFWRFSIPAYPASPQTDFEAALHRKIPEVQDSGFIRDSLRGAQADIATLAFWLTNRTWDEATLRKVTRAKKLHPPEVTVLFESL